MVQNLSHYFLAGALEHRLLDIVAFFLWEGRVDEPGTGTFVTLKHSSWLLTLSLPQQPMFPDQPVDQLDEALEELRVVLERHGE
jgi:myosin-crossreactive antigen